MNTKMVMAAPAKVNLTFDIVGSLGNGYHAIESVMIPVDLCDQVELQISESGQIQLYCDRPHIPTDNRNICHKAAEAFFRETGISNPGLIINLTKNIPDQAGLGGGSADGAAVLKGLNEIFDTGLTLEELKRIGVQIGADLPVCIWGENAFVRGIGEILAPLGPLPECYLVIAKPSAGSNTKEAYRRYDRGGSYIHPENSQMVRAITDGGLEDIGRYAANLFEEILAIEEVALIKKQLLDCGALGAVMSGSGTAVVGIFEESGPASRCAGQMKLRWPFACLCQPLDMKTRGKSCNLMPRRDKTPQPDKK